METHRWLGDGPQKIEATCDDDSLVIKLQVATIELYYGLCVMLVMQFVYGGEMKVNDPGNIRSRHLS